MILRAYKTQLDVNNRQQTLLLQHLGCARWTYNWALAKKKEAFDKKEKIPSAMDLHKELVKLKKTHTWFYDSSKASPQNALRDCDTAFKNFLDRCKKKISGKKGFPKFKSKRNEKQAFRLDGVIRVESGHVQLPRLGKLRFCERNYVPTDQRVLSATVSKRAGKWFVSVLVEAPDVVPVEPRNDVVGVDLGIKTLATCSDGTTVDNPKALKSNLKKLKRNCRLVSRKQKGSNNREKARLKLARLYYKISNIRKDVLHKATFKIVNDNQVIVLEDLAVSNMMKNHKLALAIADVGMFEFRRQIEYKAKWRNREVIIADRFFPSSKLCSSCGWKKDDLTLSDRVFECGKCGNVVDRDLNAGLNLAKMYRDGLSRINACGDGSSSGSNLVSPSLKQEFDREFKV